jgi:hypothetical protein
LWYKRSRMKQLWQKTARLLSPLLWLILMNLIQQDCLYWVRISMRK